MNGKRYSSPLFGLLAVSLILFEIPLKASAYRSGSESDLAANPELTTFRHFGAGSADNTLALNPALALISSYIVGDSSGFLKIDSVRWSALGVYYAENMARLRGAEADSARWVAMGTLYSFDPYRYALGLYHAHFASNPEPVSLQQYETCGC